MNEEACHLMTGVPTLWMAEPQLDSLEGRTNSPGMVTGSSKVPGPVPSQFLPQWVEEQTDHLLGTPRQGASDRETWGLRKMEVL